ncbi:MAG: nucleotidyl transferase AbiEii/AbiGii toxin family protein [Gammaproteobacteria bacterium]|nr:nucleotidyl transferase AbiEii/AbiGii toxin family protein [Gammaproteobacteria bacterium]
MQQLAQLSSSERAEVFTETASVLGMTPVIVEKDYWVSWALCGLFNDALLASKLMFKGGTSLSKIFGLIERFSEDIDLILDWRSLTDEDMNSARSRNKDVKLGKNVNALAIEHISHILHPAVSKIVGPICECRRDVDDPFVLNIHYPASFTDRYLRPEIRLEIGPMAAWSPSETRTISPLVSEVFPDLLNRPECSVNVISAKRTFWEKATILHHEANRPVDASPQPQRYSRHYYDLVMMAQSSVKQEALADLELLTSVVNFKQRFYPRGWARYEDARPGSFKLVPQDHVLITTEKDYQNMKNMIYGKYPSFTELLERLVALEAEINDL